MATVKVATCQFPVSDDVEANLRQVLRQARSAKRRGADVAHFPEGALSGYAGSDFDTFDGFDWEGLREATDRVLDAARGLGMWLVVGSAHRLSDGHKPHNSLGDHPSVWEIKGVRCGALICYEYRFPELYRQYAGEGVQLVFHSFHAANASPEQLADIGAAIGPGLRRLNPAATFSYPGITMPAAMTAAAASNHMWISCPNSSAPESAWPAFFVRADGITVGRARRNRPGVVRSTVDTDEELYHSTAAWRERALTGVLHSGTLIEDPRSSDRKAR